MIGTKLESNFADVARQAEQLAAAIRDKAVVRALNKTAKTVQTEASREIRAEGYGLKVTTIKRAMSIRRASRSNLTATIIASGKGVPLMEFQARQTKAGVSVNVLHGRKTLKGAFIATMKSGHEGVWKRKPGTQIGKRGKPVLNRKIEEKFGPAVPSALLNDHVTDALKRVIAERYPKVLAQEIRFELLKAGR